MKILIINGNTDESNDRIVALGGERYGVGYEAALKHFEPGLDCTVVDAAVPGRNDLPAGVGLSDFDGIAWTGSALNVYRDEPAVRRQVELGREVAMSGVPCFGSCWGLQVMCVVYGGEVRANPAGVEIGIARRIRLTDEGRDHPLYAGKGPVFDAVAIHRDEVSMVPTDAQVLATNDKSAVQAMQIEANGGNGDFWGVQYHPEFGLKTISFLIRRDQALLMEQGLFRETEDVERLVGDFQTLDEEPERQDLAWRYGVDGSVLDPDLRMAEFDNWLREKVGPYAQART